YPAEKRVDGVRVSNLVLEARERPVTGPYQALPAADRYKSARAKIGKSGRLETKACGKFHPSAAAIDRPQNGLEAGIVHALRSVDQSQMIDHQCGARRFDLGDRPFDPLRPVGQMDVPAEVSASAQQAPIRFVVEIGSLV